MRKFSGFAKILIIILLALSISGSVFLSPQKAQAQGVILRIPEIAHNIWKAVTSVSEKIYDNVAAVAFKTALSRFLNKMAYDMATAVATGGPGQKSLIFDDPNYFLNLGDAVMGGAIDEIAQGSGFTNILGVKSLCEPIDLTTKVNLLLSFKAPSEPVKPRCSLSQIKQSLAQSANSFTNSFSLANLSLRFEMGDLEETKNTLRKSIVVEKYLHPNAPVTNELKAIITNIENAQNNISALIQSIYQVPIAERQSAAEAELTKLNGIIVDLKIIIQNRISDLSNKTANCHENTADCTESSANSACADFIESGVQENCQAATQTARTYLDQIQKWRDELALGADNLYNGILEKAFTVPDASDPNDIANVFNPEANDFGKYFMIKEAQDRNINITLENEKLLQRISKDCEPKKDPVSGMNVLPSSAACGLFNFAMAKSTVNDETYTGIFSQAASIFTNTLAGKLLQTWFEKGVANLYDKGKGKNSTNAADLASGGASRGKSAAQEKFLTLLQSNFTVGGPFEVLKELTICPEKGAGPNNCAIDPDFTQAVIERLTLKESMDKKLLDPKRPFGYIKSGSILVEPSYLSGYPYRSMIVLRKFRIIPVGWELAAEWIKDPAKNPTLTAYTLQQVVDCYENTSDCVRIKNGQPNPFYHLVDPGWVFLEQPAFCKRQGAGEKILAEEFVCSQIVAGTSSCSEYSRNVYRQEYCADEQTCLMKNEDGSCRFYGYCSEDVPSWKLDGSSCNQEYNSCQTFGNKDGANVSYLEHTISSGGCNAGNAGCLWHCEEAPLVCSGGSQNGEPCSGNNDCAPTAGGIVDGVCRPSDLWKCQGKNLIGNPSIEINSNGWSGFGTGSNNRVNIGHESFASLSSADNSLNESGWQSLPISFYSNESMDASGWVNVSVAGGGASIRLRNLTANTIIAEGEIITELNIWKPVHLVASINADANIALELVAHNNATAMFDNIGLFRGNRISFDKDVKQCEAKDAGCHEFARTTNGANLVFNPGFEIEEKSYSEAPIAGSNWYGWHLKPLSGGTVTRDTAMGKSGKASLKADVPAGSNMILGLETADPRNNIEEDYKLMPEDAYTFSIYAKSSAATCTDCLELVGDCRLGAVNEQSQTFSLTDKWERYSFDYVKNNNDGDYCVFSIRLDPSNTYWLDDAKIEIPPPAGQVGNQSTGYKDYASEKIYLNESRLSCDLSEVGCELYTPVDGEAGIPAVARTSDQCPAECAGYETYHEIPSYFDPEEDAIPEVVFPNLIPSTAIQCSAQAAGCEEFTNLDTVASGGEAKEYYTRLRQCAKPGTTDEATFYTWEGSEESGFQLRAWKLKANVDGTPFTTDGSNICDLSDPDCRVFYTQNGQPYERLLSKAVFISDDCRPLRRTIQGTRQDCENSGGRTDTPIVLGDLDIVTCYYDAIPSQGLKCAPQYAGCREYKGPQANNQKSLFKSDFEDASNPTDGWGPGTQNNESVSVGGNSLNVSGTPADTLRDVSSIVQKNKTYLLKFWAKPVNSETTILTRFSDGSSNIDFGQASLSDDWNSYMFGPGDFTTRDPGAVENLVIRGSDDYYIDNIEFIEVADDVFVIKDSWKTPASCDMDSQGNIFSGYALHCSVYTDRAKNVHNLKSFSKLCREDHVGCELLADTQNTQNPFSEWKSGEYASADVLTPIVNDDKKYCDGKFKGCQKFGRPQIDAGDSATGWNSVYLINNPDDYKEILCQNTENWCKEYKTPDGTEKYFKDPVEKLCEYKENIGVGNTVTSGWFIKGQYDAINPPECAGAMRHCSISRNGSFLFCRQDSDCQPIGKNGLPENLGTCIAKDTEWVRECPETQSSCTEYKDPLFSQTQGVKDGYYYLADTIDEGKCKGLIDEDQKCVAFNNSEKPVMNVRASGTCKAKPNLYCTTNAECSAITPDDICLMKSDRPFDPQACVRCSTDQLTCNKTGELPCCWSVPADNLSVDPQALGPCSANTILYVQKDRDCREWLSCVSSAKITNGKGEKEEVCYDVARCTRIDPVTGACLEQADDKNYCQGNLFCFGGTRNNQACQTDSDCAGINGIPDGVCQALIVPKICSADSQCQSAHGICDSATSRCTQNAGRVCAVDSDCVINQGPCIADSQTLDSPSQSDHAGAVDELRYRSGFNPYGIHWTPLAQTREGEYLPTTTMQKGQVILLEDGDFEKQNSAWSRFSNCSASGAQCVNNTTCFAGDTCELGAGICTVSNASCTNNNQCSIADSCGGVCSNNNAIRCRDNKDCGALGTCGYSSPICFVSGGACADAQGKQDDSLCPGSDVCSQPQDFEYERIKVISGLRALKLGPGGNAFQGNYPGATEVNDVKPVFIAGNTQIALSGYLNTVDLKDGAAEIEIQEFKNGAKAFEYEIPTVTAMKQEFGKPWKFYAGIFTTRPDTISIRIILQNTGANGAAFFDNFLMMPVLQSQTRGICSISKNVCSQNSDCGGVETCEYPIPFKEVYDPENNSRPGYNPFIGRSCRLYPQTNAPSCSYTNEQKQQFLGWRGFCAEPDPSNPLQCLQWLPIDQLQGEAGLGFKTESSYSGRTPLYYCAEMSLWQLRCGARESGTWNGYTKNECPTSSGIDPSCPITYGKSFGRSGSWLNRTGTSRCRVVGFGESCYWVPYRSCPYGSEDMARNISPNLIGRCDKLVEVVDAEGQNIAWANRLDQKTLQVGTPYGYIYNADQNSPLYGSILAMGQSDQLPSEWQTMFGEDFIRLGNTVADDTTIARNNGLGVNPIYPLWIVPKSEDIKTCDNDQTIICVNNDPCGGGNCVANDAMACTLSFGGSPTACNNSYCYNNAPALNSPNAIPRQCSATDTARSFEVSVSQTRTPAPLFPSTNGAYYSDGVQYPQNSSKGNRETFVQGSQRLQHLFAKSYSDWVWNVGECSLTDSASFCAGTCNISGNACIDDSYCPAGETCVTNQETGNSCDPAATGYHCSGNTRQSCVNEADPICASNGWGSCAWGVYPENDCSQPAGKCTLPGGGVCMDPELNGPTPFIGKICDATCLGGSCVPVLRCSGDLARACATIGDPCILPDAGNCIQTGNQCSGGANDGAVCDPGTQQVCTPSADAVSVSCASGATVLDPSPTCTGNVWQGLERRCSGGTYNGLKCIGGNIVVVTDTCTNKRCVDGSGNIGGFCIDDSDCDSSKSETCQDPGVIGAPAQACIPGGYDSSRTYAGYLACTNDADCAGTTSYNSCTTYNDRCAINDLTLAGIEKAGVYCNDNAILDASDNLPCRSADGTDNGTCAANWCSDGPFIQTMCSISNDCVIQGSLYSYVDVSGARGGIFDDRFRQALWSPASNQCGGNRRSRIVQPPIEDILSVANTAEMCGVAPEITFISKPGDSSVPVDIIIDAGNSVTINFLTSIDAEQRPIRNIRIDWGMISDSADISDQTGVGPYPDGTGLSPKNLDTDPFIFTSPPYYVPGTYTIRVMVQDNWNWCNGATSDPGNYGNACDFSTACSLNKSSGCDPTDPSPCAIGEGACADNWLTFPGKIIVK